MYEFIWGMFGYHLALGQFQISAVLHASLMQFLDTQVSLAPTHVCLLVGWFVGHTFESEMQKAASVASMLVLIVSTSCANLWAVHVQNSG